jgi:uncharacterized membrane protein
VPEIDHLDLFAFAWFALCWVGYTLYSDRGAEKGDNLVGAMAHQRVQWMHQMLGRDNRMVDIQIVRNLSRIAAFFASTAMLILAGLVTVLGSTDKAVRIVATVPFVSAFFKFSWSIRQLSYCSIQIGAMVPSTKVDDDCFRRADCIAEIMTLAAKHSNRGLRAYYFATALSASFIHPLALFVAATWVVIVLYRREFRSQTVAKLRASEEPAPPSTPAETAHG